MSEYKRILQEEREAVRARALGPAREYWLCERLPDGLRRVLVPARDHDLREVERRIRASLGDRLEVHALPADFDARLDWHSRPGNAPGTCFSFWHLEDLAGLGYDVSAGEILPGETLEERRRQKEECEW